MEALVNGIRMAYEDRGTGLPLVLIHGFPLDHTIWDGILPYLEGHLRMIRPDLRGFGKSEATEGVYTMRLLASDIAALLDLLTIPHAVLVGHSMGGYVALAFAQAYPERILGLGLVASQAAGDTPERRMGRIAIAEEVIKNGSRPFAELNAPQLTDDAGLQKQLYEMILHTNPTSIAAAQKGMAERPDMLPFLPEIKVPAVVMHGTADRLIPVERARESAGRLPKGRFIEIPGANHMPMMEMPAKTAEPVNQLCAEVTQSAPGAW